ncbi:MAG: hypothetical protein BMS9Abin29_0131 [Gemmatimonadota bacterium]|nr:MAG: hypothetical protein BMS9Abin29_0131 [Gemmatimonadota bacterium]
MFVLVEIDYRRGRARLASSMDIPKVRSARIEDKMHLSTFLEECGLSAFGLDTAMERTLGASLRAPA